MTTDIQLKPCPFCGRAAMSVQLFEKPMPRFGCAVCGLFTLSAAAWNRRAQLEQAQAAPVQVTDERAAFEKWIGGTRPKGQGLGATAWDDLFEAWQARALLAAQPAPTVAGGELPPLPDGGEVFTAFQMRDYARAALASQPVKADIVPGVMHCAKCNFQLNRVNLCMADGNAYAGDNKTEPCPNGCGPLWPLSWEQYAKQMQESAEAMAERAIAAEKALASQPASDSQINAAINALSGVDYVGGIDVGIKVLRNKIADLERHSNEIWDGYKRAAASQPAGAVPVAVVGDVFTLHWIGSGPIAPLIERHGIKVGDKLYTAAPTGADAGGKHD